MKVLAIIPARGGSKGVPYKNIKHINGKPLISYTIEKAKQSDMLTDVFVASDSDKILEVAKKYDCSCFKRDPSNAEDDSPVELVVLELLEHLETKYDIIMLLQPTAPIREIYDIDRVIKMFIEDSSIENIVSVVRLEDIHPGRMYGLSEENILVPIDESLESKRRQDLYPVYIRNGAIYAIKVEAFMRSKKLMLEDKTPYVMPEEKWLNIDSERDVIIGEALLKAWEQGKL